MPETQAKVNVRKQGAITVVELADRKILEELAITQIGERLSELVESEPTPRILIDFKQVEHLSSAALGMLITLNKQLAEHEGQLVLVNIHPQIYEVFKITRLNKLFTIHKSTEDGVNAFT